MKRLYPVIFIATVNLAHAIGEASSGCASKKPGTIGAVLCQVKEQALVGVIILIYIAAMLSGAGLLISAVFKLKQVKDNPTQIPVSTPAALFAAGALMLYMPSLFPTIRETVFGGEGGSSSSSVENAVSEDATVSRIPNLLDR